MPRRVACTADFGTIASRGIPVLGPVLQGLQGTGKRCTLAHIDSKEHRYACNKIKLPVKEFDTDRTARDGTLALQDVRRRSQSNKENR